ncbi:hypothetical protein OS493_003264 [Desmophyllum pertusum]|uniref:Uncharacterized protein n=1 Tax=Desmophyllum pertusum TaxID=174260 RepID=A0A9W9YGS3_9CNID|nr:hypothetical protein OS493_003264 [Desmophyllum pertusum]
MCANEGGECGISPETRVVHYQLTPLLITNHRLRANESSPFKELTKQTTPFVEENTSTSPEQEAIHSADEEISASHTKQQVEEPRGGHCVPGQCYVINWENISNNLKF